jgi:hypothetical protein
MSIAWPTGNRRWGLVAALIALLGVPLSLGGTPLWWFGGSLLLAGAALGAHVYRAELERALARLSEPRRLLRMQVVPGAVLAELSCTGVIAAVATVMMADVLGGERPVSHDHTVHYVRAWLFHEQLLPHGRLHGWSNSWFAGHPIGYLYPPGADLWVNAVHALALGALRFGESYALAFWLFHVFTGLAAYRLGRVAFGRAVGLLAGVLCLTDLAFFRMGGWSYTVEYGVWPQALSLNFGLLALCHLPAIVETRKLAPLGAFGIWMGLAIVTHPIQLVFLGPLLLASALAAGFAEGVRAPAALLRLAVGCALSLTVAALWLIPFLSTRAETNSMGVWWDTTYEMGKGLLGLRFFAGTLGYVIAFGVLGLLALLGTRRFAPLFVAFTALCIPAVSNSSFIDELHLTALVPALSKVQFIRLSTMAKPFWFVLAAYFAVAAVASARKLALAREPEPARAKPDSPLRVAILAAAVSALSLPVLVPTAEAFWTKHVRKSITTESDRPLLNDRVRLEQWLARELPRDGFYRVGVFTGHNHDLMDLATTLGRPIFKRGFTPASNFVYQMDEKDPATLEAINLRFAISKVHLPPEDFETIADLGRYRVYRFKRWQPDPFLVVEGSGRVALERFEDERIALRAAPGAAGKLRLNVSYFSRWRAYRDGKRIPIAITYLPEAPEKTGFMTVSLAPGRYEFVFEPSRSDRLALPIGIAGLLLCALLIAADRLRMPRILARAGNAVLAPLDALSEPRWRMLRLIALWVAAASVTAAGVALARWTPPLQPQDLGPIAIERVRYDFLERVSRASAAIHYRRARQPCLRQGDRLVCRDEQGNLDIDNYLASSPATLKDYILVRCVRARPVEDGLLEVTYPDVPTGDAIVGYYGIERAGRLMFKRRPVEIEVKVDGKIAYRGKTQNDNQIHWFKADLPPVHGPRAHVAFTVRADNVSKRYFCFNAQMVDLASAGDR